jgi:hypothetical protein
MSGEEAIDHRFNGPWSLNALESALSSSELRALSCGHSLYSLISGEFKLVRLSDQIAADSESIFREFEARLKRGPNFLEIQTAAVADIGAQIEQMQRDIDILKARSTKIFIHNPKDDPGLAPMDLEVELQSLLEETAALRKVFDDDFAKLQEDLKNKSPEPEEEPREPEEHHFGHHRGHPRGGWGRGRHAHFRR